MFIIIFRKISRNIICLNYKYTDNLIIFSQVHCRVQIKEELRELSGEMMTAVF